MVTEHRPSKQEVFNAFLNDGWVSIHIDPRRDGVDLPSQFGAMPHLVLQYGRDMPVPIADLAISNDGVSATLSFSRVPHPTFVPWSAIFIVACTDGRGVLYPEDVPPEVLLPSLQAADDAEASDPEGQGQGEGKSQALKTATPEKAKSKGGQGRQSRSAKSEQADGRGRHLRSVPAEASLGDQNDQDQGQDEDQARDDSGRPKRKSRPKLRLVK